MMKYLKLIRIPNLIIVAVLQAFLYLGILVPVFDVFGISASFGKAYFVLFVFTTVLVTATGYVINDILDEKADKVNKAGKSIIGRMISRRDAFYFYFALIITGFFIALVVTIHINRMSYMLIYLISVALLFLYSKYFKKQVLIGNVFVSLFISFVPGVILIFERDGLIQLHEIDFNMFRFILNIFIGFMVFSFFVTMYRELVKDVEDIEGDIRINAKTFPIVYGVEMAKILSGLIAIIILILLFYWLKMDINIEKNYMKIYVLLFVVLPLSYSVFLLKRAKTKYDFHKLSGVIKIIMLTGISILFFYM